MKKLLSFFALSLILIVIVSSCGKKISPEEEVRNYSKYFLEKLSANQLDSLMDTYADISFADSIVPLQSDTIIIAESTPGNYDVTLMDGVTLKVNRDDEGKITVKESRGLFAFPADKMDIAQKTGMANDSISDKVLADRMKDENFFTSIKNSINKIINIGSYHPVKTPLYMIDSGSGYYPIKNSTNKKIDGSDYKIRLYEQNPRYGDNSRLVNGYDIQPNSTYNFEIGFSGFYFIVIKGIKWVIPEEEVIKKYVSFTGNEYQEYLDSEK